MSKSLAASKKLMQTYLSELLTEDEVETVPVRVKEKEPKALEKLLSNVTSTQVFEPPVEPKLTTTRAKDKVKVVTEDKPAAAKVISQPVVKASPDIVKPKREAEVALKQSINQNVDEKNELKTHKSSGGFEAIEQRSYRQGDFQAMFFDVAGLMIAVPLIELGGIHNNDKTTSLMGKPDWFKGVMLYREEKVNVVDTARWVMPEKCDEKLLSALNYQYIIMLGNSSWGLTAEKLVDTVTLKQEDVKWLDKANKRPWLAGLVKNRMCALLDVGSLIKLLEKGVNITQE